MSARRTSVACHRQVRPLCAALTLALCAVAEAQAQSSVRSAPVVVTATRGERSSLDVPAAIDTLDSRDLTEARLGANVAETLPRIPGTYVQNRETYAQEQQITVRGFGARSGFGTRGIRLFADGIPASTPDGQGGSANFDFASASRIEVLRGPFSALYGNHTGGVVQIFTEDAPKDPTVTGFASFGSYDTMRIGAKFGGRYGNAGAVASGSYLSTEGYRQRSSSSRHLFNAKFDAPVGDSAKLTLVANFLDQPEDLDPLTLSAAQVAANRRQARPDTTNPNAGGSAQFNTRRSLDQKQMGAVYDLNLNAEDSLRLMVYGGQRNNIGYLALRGNGRLSSGGVSELSRDYGGMSGRWTRKTELFAGQPFTITAGMDYDVALEARKGYENNFGVAGALKRNEENRTQSWGAYGQAEWQPLPRLSTFLGLRYTQVSFRSKDNYIVTTPGQLNPDDSGSARYDAWTPVVGAMVRVTPLINVYANAGRSFETPTLIELAYRNDGSGLNFGLQPSTSNHYEIGAKMLVNDNLRLNAALFQVYSNREIVVDTNDLGRSVFKNAGATKRNGLELAAESDLTRGFFAYASYTFLRATFEDAFVSNRTSATPNVVNKGNQIPGVPQSSLYVDVGWRHAESGFFSAVENRWVSKVFANDTNANWADSYQTMDLRLGVNRNIEGFAVQAFMRANNLLAEKYIGAVAVNDGNGFFYAPAPERNFLFGASVSRQF
jgi:iron complex outermembrane receptor protein